MPVFPCFLPPDDPDDEGRPFPRLCFAPDASGEDLPDAELLRLARIAGAAEPATVR